VVQIHSFLLSKKEKEKEMSKGISSYEQDAKMYVIRRREQSGSLGLGYWGARDAIKKLTEKKEK
jgi:hypothetical protein